RYTTRGGSVTLRTFADDALACIEVLDEGSGLAEAELEKVFERFYRAPDDTTEGSGLGLATVQSIVTRLGGSVTLQNREDHKGLRALVSLPRHMIDSTST
ncbi:MAG: sensor histidine kinase, partial [Stenotrophobium sp.]